MVLNLGTLEGRIAKPVSEINFTVQRLTTSAHERKVTSTRCGASGIEKDLLTSCVEKLKCARRFEEFLTSK